MQLYEAEEYLGSLQYRGKDLKEMARMIVQMIAQVNSKKTLSATDIVKFSWDYEKPIAVVTDEEREELAKRAEEIKKKLWQT